MASQAASCPIDNHVAHEARDLARDPDRRWFCPRLTVRIPFHEASRRES
jgi:hypothetical protein